MSFKERVVNQRVIDKIIKSKPLKTLKNHNIYSSDNKIWCIAKDSPRINIEQNTSFFLHIYPMNVLDLPTNRIQYKFENLDFIPRPLKLPFWNSAFIFSKDLPKYEFIGINTGQYNNTGRLWETGLLK